MAAPIPPFVAAARLRLAEGDLPGALQALDAGRDAVDGDPRALALSLACLSRIQLAAGRLAEAFATADDAVRSCPDDPEAAREASAVRSIAVAAARAADGPDADAALRRALREFVTLTAVADLLAVRNTPDPAAALAAEGFRLRPDEHDEISAVATAVEDAADARRRADFAWAACRDRLLHAPGTVDGLPGRLGLVLARFDLPDGAARLFTLAALAAVHPDAGRLVRFCGRDPLAPHATLADLLRMTLEGEAPDAFAAVLGPSSAIRLHGLLAFPDRHEALASPLAAPALPPPDLVEYLLSGDALSGLDDPGPLPDATIPIADVCLDAGVRDRVRGAWESAIDTSEPLLIALAGRPGTGRRTLAAALAATRDLRLLVLSWNRLSDVVLASGAAATARRLGRAARLAGRVPYVDVRLPPPDPGSAAREDSAAPRGSLEAPWSLVAQVAHRLPTPLFLGLPPGAEADPAHLGGSVLFDVPAPPRPDVSALVDSLLASLPDVPALVRKTVVESAILPAEAAASCERLRRAAALGSGDLVDEALAVARRRASSEFGAYATRVVPGFGPDDLVAPPELKERLQEMVAFHRHRRQVFDQWGFGQKLPYGRALSALFAGPPGTGKTMAATIVASQLGLDLFRVDLSQVVSKYVGETEKALSRVFEAATRFRSMILFDECEALFGKRGEVRSGTDRYANLEVNFLLQMMEDFDGVTVLTTNFPQNVDEAFKRRLRFRVTFPFPDEAMRLTLWRSMIPADAPVADGIEFAYLARDYEMSGAHIKNAVIRAAFAAARTGVPLAEAHLEAAARLEYEEMGRVVRAGKGWD